MGALVCLGWTHQHTLQSKVCNERVMVQEMVHQALEESRVSRTEESFPDLVKSLHQFRALLIEVVGSVAVWSGGDECVRHKTK